jgi:hypothetical protein
MRLVLAAIALSVSLLVVGTPASAVERAGGWTRFYDPGRRITFQFPSHIFSQNTSTPDRRSRTGIRGSRQGGPPQGGQKISEAWDRLGPPRLA